MRNLRSLQKIVNPFISNAPFLYPLKTGGRERMHWQVEKGYIGNEWVKYCIYGLKRFSALNFPSRELLDDNLGMNELLKSPAFSSTAYLSCFARFVTFVQFKNLKNTHGGVLLKFQKWYQIAQSFLFHKEL